MACSANEWAKKQMPLLRAQRGNKCDICEESLQFDENGHPNLQFAHIAPTGLRGKSRGRRHRIIDIRRNPNSYRLLCIDCHREFDQLHNLERLTEN